MRITCKRELLQYMKNEKNTIFAQTIGNFDLGAKNLDDVSMTSAGGVRVRTGDVDAELEASMAGHGGRMRGPQDDVEGHGVTSW